ncbi:MAG TPA: CofC family guanylyltransferase [Ktedonobacterales bacterium]|jgi:2-phospho-L-lactate guanylyltransferase
MIWAVVPVKTLAQAKTRLAGVLTPAERATLCQVMLADVLHALRGAASLDHVLVVTADTFLAEQARAQGADVLAEASLGQQRPAGQNVALEAAAAFCRDQGARALLVVSADVPLLCSETVEALICQGMRGHGGKGERGERGEKEDFRVVLAPSSEGTGTNALFQRPPGAIPFLFGPDSLQHHQRAAREHGVPVDLFHSSGLALDIDTPADLCALLRLPTRTHTQRALHEMGILQRLAKTSA